MTADLFNFIISSHQWVILLLMAIGTVLIATIGYRRLMRIILNRQRKTDQEGDPFDLKDYRFGMAYTSGSVSKPFYIHSFGRYGVGAYAECLLPDGSRMNPQFCSSLRRAPAFDLVTKAAASGDTIATLKSLWLTVYDQSQQHTRGGELAMGVAGEEVLKEIEAMIKKIDPQSKMPACL